MNHSHPVQTVHCTDSGFMEPTLVSLYSLLKNTRSPVRTHIFGYQLTDEDWRTAERVCALFPHAQLVKHDFDVKLIDGADSMHKTIHRITFARLFLSRYISGRALYIDGDTYVHGDIAPLFVLDMEGNLLAGVQDPMVRGFLEGGKRSGWIASLNRWRNARTRRAAHYTNAMMERTGLKDIGDYLNAGVLLFDFDAIKKHPDLVAQMENAQAAARFELMDQDWINIVYAGRIKRLSMKWNWWPSNPHGKNTIARERQYIRQSPVIVHYIGPKKPWQPLPLHRLLRIKSKVFWHWKYQSLQRAFRRAMANAEQAK